MGEYPSPLRYERIQSADDRQPDDKGGWFRDLLPRELGTWLLMVDTAAVGVGGTIRDRLDIAAVGFAAAAVVYVFHSPIDTFLGRAQAWVLSLGPTD